MLIKSLRPEYHYQTDFLTILFLWIWIHLSSHIILFIPAFNKKAVSAFRWILSLSLFLKQEMGCLARRTPENVPEPTESICNYSNWRSTTVHIKRSTFLWQISRNYLLLFWPAWTNWTLSGPHCDEIWDSLNGSGMFGVWIILTFYERANGGGRLITEHWVPFTDTVPLVVL